MRLPRLSSFILSPLTTECVGYDNEKKNRKEMLTALSYIDDNFHRTC